MYSLFILKKLLQIYITGILKNKKNYLLIFNLCHLIFNISFKICKVIIVRQIFNNYILYKLIILNFNAIYLKKFNHSFY